MSITEYAKLWNELGEPIAKPLWVSDFKAISTHIRGNRDNDIIGVKRPNEPEEVMKYRYENYRAVTKGPFNTALNNLVRIMNHTDVMVTYPEGIRDYLSSTAFERKDFVNFYRSSVLRKMIEMANGVIIEWPVNVGDPEVPETLTQDLKFDILIVEPERIIHWNDDVFCFLSKEKSEVKYNKKIQRIGNVYYIILKDGLYKKIQTGNKTDNTYDIIPYYTNPTNEIYPVALGGDITSEEVRDPYTAGRDKISVEYYTSFFSSAIPFADECISQFSDHQGTLVSCSFPLREVTAEPCEADGCHLGYVSGKNGREACNSCGGTGRVAITPSPYGVLVRPPKKKLDDTPTDDRKTVDFIHPDVSILEFGGKSWRELFKDTEHALNLLFVDSAQSGVAKEIDREDKIATLDKIGRHLYDLMEHSIQIMHKFVYPTEEYPNVQIQLPSTFIEKSLQQKHDEVKTLIDMGAPDVLLAQAMRTLHSSRVNNDLLEMKIYDAASVIDPWFLKSFDTKAKMQAMGVIDEIDFAISELTPSLIREASKTIEDFVSLDYNQLKAQMTPILEAKREELQTLFSSRPVRTQVF